MTLTVLSGCSRCGGTLSGAYDGYRHRLSEAPGVVAQLMKRQG